MLSPGTTGYGSQASSLLCDAGSSAGCTTSLSANTGDPNIPAGWYYATTDATGSFNLSGDYSCTAGNPVYLYAYGGSPTYPSASNSFAINAVTVETEGTDLVDYLYTIQFNTASTELFYPGEPVTLSAFTGNYAFLNGTGYVTGNSLLGTTGFEISTSLVNAEANPAITETFGVLDIGNGELPPGYQTAAAGGIATVMPGFNPAVVNLAMLGVCPSTGTLASGGTIFNGTTSNPLSFVYLNEVSTVAAAYALEGFTPTTVSATTNATDIGSSSTNLTGIENAALNAAQLYNIGGEFVSSVFAGEGHIANPYTPAGNGSVPQNLLNTMGNILAACVDSNNTSTVDGNPAESLQCGMLFETATSNGIPKGGIGIAGVLPVDTAQAMLNIAHYPAGDHSNNGTFMSNLYTLPTGNVPFTPNLVSSAAGQPNDFTVAIQYANAFTANPKITSATGVIANPVASGPESLAIDGYGNAWMNDLSTPYQIFEMNPQGIVTYTSPTLSKLGYLTIDPSNNIYSGSNYVAGEEIEVPAAGTVNTSGTRTIYTYTGDYGGSTAPFNIAGFYNGYMSVANGAGNVYIGAAPPATTNGTTAQEYTLGLKGSANVATPGTFSSLFTPVSMGTIVGSIGAHGAVENASTNGSGDIWWSNEEYEGATSNAYAFVRVSTSGVVAAHFPIQYTTVGSVAGITSIDRPEMPAVDQSGNLWAATQLGNALLKVTTAGTVTAYTLNTLSAPFGVSIDGANNAFIANRNGGTGTSIAEFSIANSNNISPAATGYTLGGQLTGPLNVAVDQSGTLWITAYEGQMIVQWIGAGRPLYNPLSLASKNNALATAP